MTGIYDLREKVWMGNDEGPLRYDDPMLAQVAIQLMSDQLFNSDLAYIGKFELREIPSGAFRLRDKIKTKRTAVEALERIESGRSF